MPDIDQLKKLKHEFDVLFDRESPGDAAAPPTRVDALQNERTAPQLRTVVVVDDNKDYLSLVVSVLESRSCRVLSAPNGVLALPLILKSPPDLLIVDFNMPKMNGYELIQELRSRTETMRLPIIMFTGATNRQHLKTLNLDIAGFLEKPVPNSLLLQAIEKVLGPLPALADNANLALEPASRPGVPADEAVLVPVAEEPAVAPVPLELSEWSSEDETALEMLESDENTTAHEEHGLEQLANDSPLITRVNRILLEAVEMRASDIHIEPQENQVTVRVRIDGSLKPLRSLPISLHPRLSARIKIMANMVITERRMPQDGQFRVMVKGKKIEFRVSTVPSTYGEKIVLRILGQSKLKSDLQKTGMTAHELEQVQKALKSPHGLVLVTGPTGSGKTTTLYTMISTLNKPDVNIMTAEDPVEYEVPDITQVKVRPSIGLTFESVLRSFLRQDPDIMLIGEIRDLETAEISVKAAITGHLVFSTLHTNSAAATIVRLTHMGVAPFLVAASVKLIIAQRLMRLLCPSCKVLSPIPDEDKKFLTKDEIGLLTTNYRSVGCPSCRQSGYAGRRPVFEVMPLQSTEMHQLVCDGSGVDIISAQAVREGMTSLRQAALSCVAQGLSSLPDALKIVLGD